MEHFATQLRAMQIRGMEPTFEEIISAFEESVREPSKKFDEVLHRIAEKVRRRTGS